MSGLPSKNLAEDISRTVTLSADLIVMLEAYAKAEGITRDLAARQLIRDGLEGATHAGGLPVLKGKSRTILDSIVRSGKRGINCEQLVGIVYGDDPNGGPLTASNCLRVLIHNANKRHLRPVGYQIQGEHTGHGAFGRYRLVKCEASA